MKEIHSHIRDIAGFLKTADFLQNVIQTWKSPKVKQNVEEFIKVFTPYIENIKKMGERFVGLSQIMKALRDGTDNKVMVTPEMELKPVQ